MKEEDALVVNPLSGDQRTGLEIVSHLLSMYPATLFYFQDILKNPKLIEGRNVIGIGGDGTLAELAKRTDGVFFPLRGGSMGFMTKCFNWGKRMGEFTTADYAYGVAESLHEGAYDVVEFPKGIIRSQEKDADNKRRIKDKEFTFIMGIGDATTLAILILEQGRGQRKNIERQHDALHTFYHSLKDAQPHTLFKRGESYQVNEGHILKGSFKNLNGIRLPYGDDDVLITFRKGEKAQIFARLLMDTAFSLLNLPQLAGALKVTPLLPSEQVIFNGLSSVGGNIDSEAAVIGLPAVIQPQILNEQGYRIASRRISGNIYRG